MLDLPGIVVAELVGQFDLVERVLVEPVFAAGLPRARQLQLIENPELHAVLLRAGGSCRPANDMTIPGKGMPAHRRKECALPMPGALRTYRLSGLSP